MRMSLEPCDGPSSAGISEHLMEENGVIASVWPGRRPTGPSGPRSAQSGAVAEARSRSLKGDQQPVTADGFLAPLRAQTNDGQ